ncbi:hypothetical protein ABW20_dc0105471 [Dactylellina cionopaga]|nr:hypothetical protein ABW20_dc0105471 [Dactylellina cionopaga]
MGNVKLLASQLGDDISRAYQQFDATGDVKHPAFSVKPEPGSDDHITDQQEEQQQQQHYNTDTKFTGKPLPKKSSLGIYKLIWILLKFVFGFGMTTYVSVQSYQKIKTSPPAAICNIEYLHDRLESCRREPEPNKFFQKMLDQNSELAQLQTIASDNSVLPYRLLGGHSDLQSLIIELSAVHTPSKHLLMPLLSDYDELVEKVVDGIQDCLALTDSLVEKTILTTSWAGSELQTIGDRDPVMEPMYSLAIKMGVSIKHRTTEADVEAAFLTYTDRLQKQARDVLFEYQKLRENLTRLKKKLKEIAYGFKTEGVILEEKKFGESSYWKWILESHRNKMKDFDNKMELCAKFYRYSIEADEVIRFTIHRLQGIRGRIKALRNELETVPLQVQSGPGSLKLTIDAIKASVTFLENSKMVANANRRQQMEAFEASMPSRHSY